MVHFCFNAAPKCITVPPPGLLQKSNIELLYFFQNSVVASRKTYLCFQPFYVDSWKVDGVLNLVPPPTVLTTGLCLRSQKSFIITVCFMVLLHVCEQKLLSMI